MKDIGVTTEEMGRAVGELIKNIPPLSEKDIGLIKRNPFLSFFQKAKIIKRMRKTLKLQFENKENGQV
ncbi:hypothetical protein B5E53_16950 [Eubacterium sp. An11]|uniref:hypothetical protein n=1 Tax=Eubacterium sp. An11 TaxID=1965542 RepID=UPI000B37C383|nr:hypothetical protein [Eubacterium sp. An11]OUQ62911.1 hypothetical protein B5E53_16950 [Eubacterium sp. An11]